MYTKVGWAPVNRIKREKKKAWSLSIKFPYLSIQLLWDSFKNYLSGIGQVHFTSSTGSVRHVGIERVAKGWHQRTRLIEVQRPKARGEIPVSDIGDNLVNHVHKLRSNFLASKKGLLCSCVVHTRQYIV